MFKKKEEPTPKIKPQAAQEKITSILGAQMTWQGELKGRGGVRIEGMFEGLIDVDGLVVVDPKGRVTSDLIQAGRVIIAGAVRSDIHADKVEIRSTGRVWGDVLTTSLSTEEGAYLRGKIQMEEETVSGNEENLPGEEGPPDPESGEQTEAEG